jgi:hypothetical protein
MQNKRDECIWLMTRTVQYVRHKVRIYKEYHRPQCMSSRRNWDSPNPSRLEMNIFAFTTVTSELKYLHILSDFATAQGYFEDSHTVLNKYDYTA